MSSTASAKTLRFVLGDQLNYRHSWLSAVDDDVVYVLMETRSETDYTRHHVQKVVAFFLSMRAFAEHLRAEGHRVHYLRLDAPDNKQSLVDNLAWLAEHYGVEAVEHQLPDEYRLDETFADLSARLSVPLRTVDTEHFMTTRDDLATFFEGKKRYTMEYFYRDMRKRFGILVDDEGEPAGGAWNFDQDNRNKIPKSIEVPDPIAFDHEIEGIVEMLAEAGVATMGQVDAERWEWPTNREEGLRALDDFVKRRLHLFGTYQDAMTERDPYLFHARISFALNTKQISPLEVVEAVVTHYHKHRDAIGINQVEGFIRQVIGWREYMRGIYWAHMPAFGEMNALEHTGELPKWYWDGDTKMNCLKHAIDQSLELAYAHHIQRLMITGNFALILGVDPDEVDHWYLGVYIDAIEWVEITNTRGMSQFADGGIVGTKPYMSSANYINKMSDYCKGCHYDHKARHGVRACPFNSLYWAFVERHRERLARNGRIGQMVRIWDRMQADEREATLAQAEHYMANRHEL